MKIIIPNQWHQQKPTVKNYQYQTYHFKTLKTKRIIITKILLMKIYRRIITLNLRLILATFKNFNYQILNKNRNLVLWKSAISKFLTSVERDHLVQFTLSDTSKHILSSPWKKYSSKNWPLKSIDNVSLGKRKFIWNLIIQISLNFIQHFRLKKQFISLWNFVALEIFIKNLKKKDHFHKTMLGLSSGKYVMESTISMKWISFTEILRLKILSFMEMLQKSVILDGPLKDNNQENHFVELQFIFLLKL